MCKKHCLTYLSNFCSVVNFEASSDKLIGEDATKERSRGTISRTLASAGWKRRVCVETARCEA